MSEKLLLSEETGEKEEMKKQTAAKKQKPKKQKIKTGYLRPTNT